MNKPNTAENHYHHKGCLSYRTLNKYYNQQNKQISKAAIEIFRLQRFRSQVYTMPFLARLHFLFTGKLEDKVYD
jgi:hypothetical protein